MVASTIATESVEERVLMCKVCSNMTLEEGRQKKDKSGLDMS